MGGKKCEEPSIFALLSFDEAALKPKRSKLARKFGQMLDNGESLLLDLASKCSSTQVSGPSQASCSKIKAKEVHKNLLIIVWETTRKSQGYKIEGSLYPF